MIVWSSLGLSHMFWAFTYWRWFNNSIIDLISFVLNVLIWSQNLVILGLTLRDVDSESARALFWKSTLYSAVGPWFIWPLTLIANIVHAVLFKDSKDSYKNYDEETKIYLGTNVSYIVVKNFLFFLYNLIVVFISFETLFPIYEWWQTLANLAVKVPYVRPTEKEVAAADFNLLFKEFSFGI